MLRHFYTAACLFLSALVLSACGSSDGVSPANLPIPQDTLDLMKSQGLKKEAPIFMRVFKREAELEIWKQRDDGRFALLKTYPICKWSGKLGPKLKEGDKQAPEGFYTVSARQMNPNSRFHLSFNLGFPNRFDQAYDRTGSFLMVHGACSSVGCYAMTDVLIEEIYALAREAFAGGQEKFHVQALPFRMSDDNMKKYAKGRWAGFWRNLKAGSDAFESTHIPPKIDVCERRYVINAAFPDDSPAFGAREICPPYQTFVPDIIETPAGPKIIQARIGSTTYDGRAQSTSFASGAVSSGPVGNRSLAAPGTLALRNAMTLSR